MDTPLSKARDTGATQDPIVTSNPPSSIQNQPRSSLADDLVRAQEDLAAAASGKNIPVDEGTDDVSPLTPQQAADETITLGSQPQPPAQFSDQGTTDLKLTSEEPPTPPPPPISGPKEQRELGPATEPEQAPLTEYEEPEPEPEVKNWMEKLEEGETVQLPQPVTDDFGQVLVQAAGQTKPKIVLPLDETGLSIGLHQKVIDSVRWLAEWCVRVMKMATGRVFYKAK